MKLKSSNKVDTNRFKLEIEVEAENFQKAINKVFKKQSKKISIPGFRKGKAPRSFIEKYYGENIFYEDAINDLYPEVVSEAVEEAGLDVINDKVDFNLIKSDKTGLEFEVTLTVRPEVEIENYKGINVKEESIEVTEEDINKEIEAIRERNSRLIAVEDRPVKSGDITVIDFKGFIDGEAFSGGEAKNHTLKIGSGAFIPGFEDQIIGHNTNDEFDVNVKFPEDYQAKEYAGKDAKFEVKLHEIKIKELPELDDEFVADVSEFNTLEEYREDVKKQITERKKSESEKNSEDQIINKLVENLKAEVPNAMFENRIDDDIKDFAYRLQSQGLNIETYLQYAGMDKNALRDNFRPMAERQVKLELALEKIAKIENLNPDENEIEDRFKELAMQYKMEANSVKNMVQEKEVKKELSLAKAFDLVKDNIKKD